MNHHDKIAMTTQCKKWPCRWGGCRLHSLGGER